MNFDPTASSFVLSIAANLVTALFQAAPRAVREIIHGSPQQDALASVYEKAFKVMLSKIVTHVDVDMRAHLDTLLSKFVTDPSVSSMLFGPAISSQEPPIEALQQRFNLLGYDVHTLGIDLDDALGSFYAALAQGLSDEAGRPGSPLHELYVVGQFAGLRHWLERNQELQSETVTILRRIDALLAKGTPDPGQIAAACYSITRRVAGDIAANRPVIVRNTIRAPMMEFLESEERYCVLLGPSGVGKSIAMALEALHMHELGWIPLLVPSGGLSLTSLAEQLENDSSAIGTYQWRDLLVKPWERAVWTDSTGFIILIDAVDEANPEEVANELQKLHLATGHLPQIRFKIVLSCHAYAWEILTDRLPFLDVDRSASRQMLTGVRVIQVGDFANDDLDKALEKIGANELISLRTFGEWSDPHVESLRDLLKHPGTFGIYSELRSRGAAVEDLTWSDLVEGYLHETLRFVERRCEYKAELLQEDLISLSRTAWLHKERDFFVDLGTLRVELPQLRVEDINPRSSPYAALLESGFLVEHIQSGAEVRVGFRHGDAGRYLVSVALQLSFKGKSEEDAQEALAAILEQVYDYPPLIDALLAWINRSVQTEDYRLPVTLLNTVIGAGHTFHVDVLFSLAQPAVLNHVFEAVKQNSPEHFYLYKRATQHINATTRAREEIRRRLHDRNPRARELAAFLAGVHRDVQSIPALIELLVDSDEDVYEAAHTALGQLGTSSIPQLLTVFTNRSSTLDLRRKCLSIVGSIGYRTPEITMALESYFDNEDPYDPELLRSALWVLYRLRDPVGVRRALTAVTSTDWEIAHSAALLLKLFPDPATLSTLEEALHLWKDTEAAGMAAHFVVRAILDALAAINIPEAEAVILALLMQALQGDSNLSETEAVWEADDLGLLSTRRLLVEDLMRRAHTLPSEEIVWQHMRRISRTWEPQHLEAVMNIHSRVG